MPSAAIKPRRDSILDSALALAAQGFRVFPLAAGTSVPPKGFFKFQDQASTDPAKIREWWKENPRYNVAVATGRGLVVVDVDVKKGKKGADSLEALEALGLPLDGYRVDTPSGGVHVFLRTEHPHHQVIDNLEGFPGIDIKCEGNYVVGAGSIRKDFPGKPYTQIGPAEIPSAPTWLDDIIIKSTPKRTERTEQPLVELDKPSNVANAIEYLAKRAPEAIEGAGGDTITFQVAARLRDYAISPPKAWELMLDHWNEQKASPPWPPEDLLCKIENAYAYATGSYGGEDLTAFMDVVEGIDLVYEAVNDNASPQKANRFKFETLDDLATLPKAKWLVDGWIPENSTGILYGKWGSGKSFLAFDLGLHVAYGMADWHGAELPGEPRKVLVLAREGHQGFVDRAAAFRKHHDIKENTSNFVFLRTPVSFMSADDFKALERHIKECGEQFSLVIIDTVARVMAGADMSAPESVTAFMERCDRLGAPLAEPSWGFTIRTKAGQ